MECNVLAVVAGFDHYYLRLRSTTLTVYPPSVTYCSAIFSACFLVASSLVIRRHSFECLILYRAMWLRGSFFIILSFHRKLRVAFLWE